MNKPKRVEFKTTDGVTLRGDYFRVDGKKRPVVIMNSGLALLKKHFLPKFAEYYDESGISSLAFDCRSWGSSDGTPAQETNLLQQAEDFRDAVSAAMKLPGVDPEKIVVMGLGHSGAAALLAIADDPRPKAAILQSPIVSGRRDAGMFPKAWVARAWRDRETKTHAGDLTPTYIVVWPKESGEAAKKEEVYFPNEMANAFITEALIASNTAKTPWENKMTLRSILGITGTEAGDSLHKISQPTLYVVFPGDPFTGMADFHKAAFDRMGKNGEFKIVEPKTDGTIEDFVTSTAKAQVEFLKRVL